MGDVPELGDASDPQCSIFSSPQQVLVTAYYNPPIILE
jgi:hypothetical protein